MADFEPIPEEMNSHSSSSGASSSMIPPPAPVPPAMALFGGAAANKNKNSSSKSAGDKHINKNKDISKKSRSSNKMIDSSPSAAVGGGNKKSASGGKGKKGGGEPLISNMDVMLDGHGGNGGSSNQESVVHRLAAAAASSSSTSNTNSQQQVLVATASMPDKRASSSASSAVAAAAAAAVSTPANRNLGSRFRTAFYDVIQLDSSSTSVSTTHHPSAASAIDTGNKKSTKKKTAAINSHVVVAGSHLLNQQQLQHRSRRLHSAASAAETTVSEAPSSLLNLTPCDKHPPEYFAQMLHHRESSSKHHHHHHHHGQQQQQQNAKLNQLWPKHWGSYNDQPERDSLDGILPSSSAHEQSAKSKRHLMKEKEAAASGAGLDGSFDPPLPPRLSGLVTAGGVSVKSKSIMKSTHTTSSTWTGEREPFTHLWVTLSSMYGKLLVVLMAAFCFTEVMDNSIKPLTFQGVYMIYLYVGSILAIMCIYISLLLDQCPSLTKSRENLTAADPESGSIGSFDTLKRAHISRSKTPRTSFYLRVGALVFGLATLIFNGLEIAMHATMEGKCVADIVFAHPILQALFTFLQMHFLFVNSEVLVEKFGLLARFGFMHLIATNVSLWVRTVVWESANEWLHYLHHQQQQLNHHSPIALQQRAAAPPPPPPSDYSYFDEDFDANSLDYSTVPLVAVAAAAVGCNNTGGGSSTLDLISQEHIRGMVGLYECFNNNTLGKIWTTSMPYLFPFLVEYNLIAAAVAYIMWRSVGQLKKNGIFQSRLHKQLSSVPDDINNTLDPHRPKGHWRVDCQGASKGLFLGLLSLVAGIIVLIIFFVMKDNVDFRSDLFWLCSGTQLTILSLAIVFTIVGFVQLPKLSLSLHKPLHLDVLLANITTYGVFIYAIFGLIVGGTNLSDERHIMVFVSNGLLLIQATLQGMFIAEASKRVCTSRYQMLFKPGRQIVTFLLFANITLWLLDTFMSHNWMTQELQFSFYGYLAWGIISRLALPLLVFYRFHSAVVLIEIWKNTYRTKDV